VAGDNSGDVMGIRIGGWVVVLMLSVVETGGFETGIEILSKRTWQWWDR
jgi:hypothetical protein